MKLYSFLNLNVIIAVSLLPLSTLSTRVHVTTTTNTEAEGSNGNDKDNDKDNIETFNNNNEDCRWGEPCQSINDSTITTTTKNTSLPTTTTTTEHIPFLRTATTNRKHDPPLGFVLSARVYTSPDDFLAHFDTVPLVLEFSTCGVAGSTTTAIPIQHAYFRQSLMTTKPTTFQGTEYGPHPQLLIALSHITMELNSGQVRQFKAGSVILLENVVSGGHKVTSTTNDDDVVVLLLTLPQHYHYVGKERTTLPNGQRLHCRQDGTLHRKLTRKYILGAFGTALTLLIADYLGKVAPLWLSVGIGGTCFVMGGTWLVVEGGDRLADSIEYMLEQRKMTLKGDDNDAHEMDHVIIPPESVPESI